MTNRPLLVAFATLAVLAASAREARAYDPPSFVRMWGSNGYGQGQFVGAQGVACGPDGSVYVCDDFRVERFDESGGFIAEWGSLGYGPGQFTSPLSIATDAAGFVYVADYGTSRIEKFTSSGAFVTQWGAYGAGNGQFDYDTGVAVSPTGDIYVCDDNNHRIQVFSNTGTYKSQWSTDLGKGYGPYAASFSSTGHLFVLLNTGVNTFVSEVAEFTSAGSFVKDWPSPSGVAENLVIDALDHVYIPEPKTGRVWVYDTSGAALGFWGSKGTGSGQFDDPVGLGTFGSKVYVGDFQNCRVQLFDYHPPIVISPYPELVSKRWDWTDYTLRIDLQYGNPSTLAESLPLDGSVYTQLYGAFMPGLPTPVADFSVPALRPGSQLDVFADIPIDLLPPSAPLVLAGGGPVAGGPCAPPGWSGGIDLVWNEGTTEAHSAWQSGEVLVGPGSGYSYIGVSSGSTTAMGSTWGFDEVCPGFTATLFEADRVTPAPDTLPPGWNGFVGVTADASVPAGSECCLILVLRRNRAPATVGVCARTCPWSTVSVALPTRAPGILGVTPNPASRSTTIRFGIAQTERATLEVLDVAGRRVSTLCDGVLSGGVYVSTWDGVSANGRLLPAGTYFLRLRAGDTTSRSTVILTR